MAVTLLRPYGTFATGAIFIGPDDTEAALIAQGYAVAATGQPAQSFATRYQGAFDRGTFGGNLQPVATGGSSAPTTVQGPRILPNVPIGAFASMGTSAVHVAGTWYRSEIYVPHVAQWTGLGVLNGATASTDGLIFALYDTNGNLITNTTTAGVTSSGANAFQNIAFVNSPILQPGRYFVAVQCQSTTATTRRQSAAMGGNLMTSSAAGTWQTVPASFTPPTTFTADVGPIAWLYQ